MSPVKVWLSRPYPSTSHTSPVHITYRKK